MEEKVYTQKIEISMDGYSGEQAKKLFYFISDPENITKFNKFINKISYDETKDPKKIISSKIHEISYFMHPKMLLGFDLVLNTIQINDRKKYTINIITFDDNEFIKMDTQYTFKKNSIWIEWDLVSPISFLLNNPILNSIHEQAELIKQLVSNI
jgi:hypothetical protein